MKGNRSEAQGAVDQRQPSSFYRRHVRTAYLSQEHTHSHPQPPPFPVGGIGFRGNSQGMESNKSADLSLNSDSTPELWDLSTLLNLSEVQLPDL